MPDWSVVTRAHVLNALAEHDQLGDREFLRRYGFGRAHAYVLWHSGRDYDSQAISGVAYLHATGQVLTPRELASERDASARVLTGLGFDVVVDEELAAQQPAPRPPAPKPAPRVAKASAAGKTAAEPKAPRPARKTAAPTRRATKPEPVYTFCPTCYTALPATGVCDFCD